MLRKLLSLLILLTITLTAQSQFVRKEMVIPDIPGYKTLKCDFHTHTVFSDGNVWPTVRVDEAWGLGYDAIAITDHIEYQPHKKYIPVQHDASYEIAKPKGDRQDLIVIRGSEVTRVMPPGHLNAIFISDATRLETDRIREMHAKDHRRGAYLDSIDHQHKDYMIALEEAVNQGGFVFWNHPGWPPQAKDGIKLWDAQKELIQKGLLMGIEVANMSSYYPEAFRWALEYNLTMLGNSDIHATEEIFKKVNKVERRPVTLVFAKERSAESIRDALDDRRTAVWIKGLMIGREVYLEPLFQQSVNVSGPFYTSSKGVRYYNLKNRSDFSFELKERSGGKTIDLLPQSTIVIKAKKGETSRGFSVENFLVEPEKTLAVELLFP
jgi:histidinol phosphatase-like PHP family hydrolase